MGWGTLCEAAEGQEQQQQDGTDGPGSQLRFKKGDGVLVIKKGSEFGQNAVVSSPDWSGRVKVKMDKSGHTKSYYEEELELPGEGLLKAAKLEFLMHTTFETHPDVSKALSLLEKSGLKTVERYQLEVSGLARHRQVQTHTNFELPAAVSFRTNHLG